MLSARLQDAAITSETASQRLSVVIIGLLVLAVVIAAATIVFWRLTRPERSAPDADLRWIPATSEPGDDASGAPPGERDEPPR